MNIFGKKKAKAPQAPRLIDSIQQLRDAQNKLDLREKHLEKQSMEARNQAKEKLKLKDKKGALFLLKRSKMIDSQINQIHGKKLNLEVQIGALESAASNRDIFNVMKLSNEVLKHETAVTNVDAVGDLMAEIEDTISDANEVNEELSRPIGAQMDDDELTRELEEMEQESIDQDLLSVPDVPISIPTKIPTSTATVVPPVISASTPPSTTTTITNSSSSTTRSRPAIDEKEARELQELEAAMAI
jgi:charged multivesicular body protein 4